MGLYFIQAGEGGDIKVGKTDNIRSRLAAHQTHNSRRIRLLAWHSGWGLPEERRYKQELKAYQTEAANEWLVPDPVVIAALNQCLADIASNPTTLFEHLTMLDEATFGGCDCCADRDGKFLVDYA